jgi:hypothetical protein
MDTQKGEQRSQEEVAMLETAVKGNFIFSQLSAADRGMMFDAMEKRCVQVRTQHNRHSAGSLHTPSRCEQCRH